MGDRLVNDLLVDTCAAIWILSDELLGSDVESAIADAIERGSRLVISPISAWEVGMLMSRGRLTLPFSSYEWYARLAGLPDVVVAPLLPKIMIDSSFLPGVPPRDPADRVIIATAREMGYRIVTRDRKILDYAEKGHVMALAC